ncbi:hypothetical protein EXN66_Car011565 [Channa argus]|uniref:Uncharacterized protein n=1 Tax=Channa argus TaxID=215402 RepID=A0A6G1Q090_CHAAH|nr:hypothetical protein EXN66_Car011565 [Channa argus]
MTLEAQQDLQWLALRHCKNGDPLPLSVALERENVSEEGIVSCTPFEDFKDNQANGISQSPGEQVRGAQEDLNPLNLSLEPLNHSSDSSFGETEALHVSFEGGVPYFFRGHLMLINPGQTLPLCLKLKSTKIS